MANKKAALLNRLKEHFESDPATLPVIRQDVAIYERPNMHLAIEELLGDGGAELVGVVDLDYEVTLARISRQSSAKEFDEGPVEYFDVPVAGGRKLACVKKGIYLFADEGSKCALLVGEERYGHPPKLKVEVMASQREVSEGFLRKLIAKTRQGKAYRGHVLSIERDCYGGVSINFHSLPKIERERVILPEKVLQTVERHTIDFSQNVKRLRAAGRHLKRGILLHGKPGTGKTLSAMYLVSKMPKRTVLLMTGAAIGSIETACSLARMLQPATVILEDVDLIGTQRSFQTVDANALLFELLNQMDGLAEDVDVLFVLTTNRPDILEPALAARPGRIDQAIEIPLPDDECRQRLIDLYGQGLQLELGETTALVEKTAGASAAFIRELLRRAAVFAAVTDQSNEIVVRDEHVEEALTELLVTGGELTKSLLGASDASAQDE
ncbi:MAG: ATP-binding protein [Pirellulaceae bacterium]|jgi:SpoVK/Ycf46/Vps4 family AAA+-type ATPase|nr:ATP-binding protein [Pirellulaceae bacterium]